MFKARKGQATFSKFPDYENFLIILPRVIIVEVGGRIYAANYF